MSAFYIIIIIVAFTLFRAGKKANKQKSKPQNKGNYERRASTNPKEGVLRAKIKQKPPANPPRTSSVTPVVNKESTPVLQASPPFAKPNLAESSQPDNTVPFVMMETIRDLIVCGYPTELPNQRDFIKEGEDFLAGLSSESYFF